MARLALDRHGDQAIVGDGFDVARAFDRFERATNGVRVTTRLHLDAVAAFELRGQIVGCVNGGDLAFVDDDDAVAGHFDFGQDVR